MSERDATLVIWSRSGHLSLSLPLVWSFAHSADVLCPPLSGWPALCWEEGREPDMLVHSYGRVVLGTGWRTGVGHRLVLFLSRSPPSVANCLATESFSVPILPICLFCMIDLFKNHILKLSSFNSAADFKLLLNALNLNKTLENNDFKRQTCRNGTSNPNKLYVFIQNVCTTPAVCRYFANWG